MTNQIIKYQFKAETEYTTDQGQTVNFNPLLRPPTDFTDTIIDGILTAIGAERRLETTPCGESARTRPRKLTFLRKNGNSFSVILPNREAAIASAAAIVGLVDDTDHKVICITLEGEHTLNLIDILAPANKAAPVASNPIKPSPSRGKSREDYTGVMKEYKADTPFGTNAQVSFKTQTDTDGDAPPSILSEVFKNCVDPVTTAICSGGSTIEYRRYIPSILTVGEPVPPAAEGLEALQTVTVPIKGHTAPEILKCGQDIAKVASVVCLEYFGESNSALHRLILD